MRRAFLAAPVVALLVSGCGAAQETSEGKFKAGDQQQVAKVVDELSSAAARGNTEKICNDILARSLVQELEAAGADCTAEMEKAIEDADNYELDVRDVTISGGTATATVRRGDDGPTDRMEFTREGDDWRATSLSDG